MRRVGIGSAVLLIVGAAAAQAQGGGGGAVGVFVARDHALPGAPYLYGASFSSYSGALGLRLGGGVRLGRDDEVDGSGDLALRAWAADIDALVSPSRFIGRDVFGGFDVAGFIGIGAHGVRATQDSTAHAYTWSYGGGIAHRLAGPVGIAAEMRYRVPISSDDAPVPADFERGWEYRVGLHIPIGGSSDRGRGHHQRSVEKTRPAHRRTASIPSRSRGKTVSTSRVLHTADRYVGTRYRYGGTDPRRGFDCSGFVQYVYARHDVELPRTSRQQALVGDRVRVDTRSLRAGDLIFFDASGDDGIDHVAIYAGRDRIIHSSSSGDGVRYDDLSSKRGKWFMRRAVGARRVVANGRDLVGELEALLWELQKLERLDPPDLAPRP